MSVDPKASRPAPNPRLALQWLLVIIGVGGVIGFVSAANAPHSERLASLPLWLLLTTVAAGFLLADFRAR
jgi:hypothetical protein